MFEYQYIVFAYLYPMGAGIVLGLVINLLNKVASK